MIDVLNSNEIYVSDRLSTILRESHLGSVNSGWWTDLKTGDSIIGKKNMGEMLMLIVSELCEACEAGFDDKLPQYPTYLVELADVVIRCGDTAYGMGVDIEPALIAVLLYEKSSMTMPVENPFNVSVLGMIRMVSEGMEAHRKKNRPDGNLFHLVNPPVSGLGASLARVVLSCFVIANSFRRDDLETIIAEKLAYNSKRPDHKIENRKSDDSGKLY